MATSHDLRGAVVRAPDAPLDAPAVLRMTGMGTTFPGVRALHGVDPEVLPGDVQAIVGEAAPERRR